jgi:hypothetical protein
MRKTEPNAAWRKSNERLTAALRKGFSSKKTVI